ncbi:Scr1 family TA system antitoxin-like transcriptional regulator [Streptomyces sp. NPDC056716]|uniref:Scr1 family TA system antitoxin-like transcriptional regulator n=1 Tax=unclassified Streptomyces TaxID=2593676 RepID=UPI0036B7B3A0
MERQCVLHDAPRTFSFLIEESVLSHGFGDAEAQTEQLERLLTVGALPHIGVGIVPTRLGRSRMPVEGFWIFDRAQVNVELVSGHLTLTPSEVAMYADTFSALAEMAVYGARARALIRRAADSLVPPGTDRPGGG